MKLVRGTKMERRSCIFRFADVEVDERNFSVAKAGEVLSVEPKVFKVLQFLLHHPGRVVTKDELLDAVWSDTSVSESSLTRTVATLRRLLGDDIHEPRYIATIPTVGYRFLCNPQVSEDGFVPATPFGGIAESLALPTPTSIPASPAEKPRPRQKRGLIIVAACFVCALLTAGLLAYKKWHANPAPPVQRALSRVSFDEGLQTGATWSPDGRFIAYSSDRGGKFDIWVQEISGGGDPIQVTKGPGQNWQPDWSPDGKYIAYRSEDGDGGIYITPALGGAGQQRKISPFGYFPRWSPDSSRILFQSAMGYERKKVYVVGLDGDSPREVLTDLRQHGLDAVFAIWHPDGKRITAWTDDASDAFPVPASAIPSFSTEPVDGGPAIESRVPPELEKQIDAAGAGPGTAELRMDFRFAWAPSGKAVFFERSFHGARNVWRMTVDPVTLQPVKIERLTTSPGFDAELSISPDGTRLAFTGEHHQLRAWAFPFDANHGRVTGTGEPITTGGIEAWALSLSRDGKKLAVRGTRNGQPGLWEVAVSNGA